MKSACVVKKQVLSLLMTAALIMSGAASSALNVDAIESLDQILEDEIILEDSIDTEEDTYISDDEELLSSEKSKESIITDESEYDPSDPETSDLSFTGSDIDFNQMPIKLLDGTIKHITDFDCDYLALVFGRTKCSNTCTMLGMIDSASASGKDITAILMDVDEEDAGIPDYQKAHPNVQISLNPYINHNWFWRYVENYDLKDHYGDTTTLPVVAVYDKNKNLIHATVGFAGDEVEKTFGLILADSMNISCDDDHISIGETRQLYANFIPENTSDKRVTWSSSDESVAIVDQSGKVTGVSEGYAVIYAQPQGYKKYEYPGTEHHGYGVMSRSHKDVYVRSSYILVSGVSLDKEELTLKVGGKARLNGTIYPENATYKPRNFESSNPEVATVDFSGNVTAVSEGEAIITFSSGKFSATCKVTVTKDGKSNIKPISSVKIAGLKTTVTYKGSAFTIADLYNVNDKTCKKLGWNNVTLYVADKDTKQTYILTEGKDYSVSVEDKADVGKIKVTFTGLDGYKGTVQKTVTVKALNAAKEFDIKVEDATFTKAGIKPLVTVTYEGKTLTEETDYTVTYKNNKKAALKIDKKAPYVIIKGKGNYSGTSGKVPFTITKASVKSLKMQAKDVTFKAKGKKGYFIVKPTFTDTEKKVTIGKNKDIKAAYTYTYAEETTLKDGTVRNIGDEVDPKDKLDGPTSITVTAAVEAGGAKSSYEGEAKMSYTYHVVNKK